MKKFLLLGAAVCALAIPVGASASTITQVMHGLDNPKGLAFGPEGGLYVAEADGHVHAATPLERDVLRPGRR